MLIEQLSILETIALVYINASIEALIIIFSFEYFDEADEAGIAIGVANFVLLLTALLILQEARNGRSKIQLYSGIRR